MAPLTRVLLALTFVTGIVDAVSFLALGQVFSAMQTGNVIFLGFGLAGTADAPTAAPLVGLGAFLLGGGVAGLLARKEARLEGSGLVPALAGEVALLAAAAVVAVVVDVDRGHFSAYLLIAMLSLAMGLRNTVVRGFGGPNLATTVLNLSLSAMTTHAPLSLASGEDLGERAGGFVAILVGAAAGALLLRVTPALPLATAAAITLVAALARLRITARAA